MIFPFPENIHPVQKYPLTMALIISNCVIFLLIFASSSGNNYKQQMFTSDNLELTGELYKQWGEAEAADVTSRREQPDWLEKLKSGNKEQMQVLGAYGLRDAAFLSGAHKFNFQNGNQVLISEWKAKLSSYRDFYIEQSIFQYGLNSWMMNPLSWITYQFSHSSWVHLLSNMVFLVLMGTAVEALVGSFGVLIIYILGGVAGGIFFTLQNAHGVVPMIGASASISALMAFYCVAEPRLRIRYFYMLLPMNGYFGAIYLPTLLIIPLFILADVSSLISTPEGWGVGVAYSAHLGGALWGLLTGLIYFLFRKKRPNKVLTKLL